MGKKINILIVEDDYASSLLFKRVLINCGYNVDTASNGQEAIEAFEKLHYDILITDWMMPVIDGIELIKTIRYKLKLQPSILMATALVSEESKLYALKSGADDFITKPVVLNDLVQKIEEIVKKRIDSSINVDFNFNDPQLKRMPLSPAICITSSTGGPNTLMDLFKLIPINNNFYYFIVQHGPAWMLDTFSKRLASETGYKVELPQHNTKPQKGTIYIAPGDHHMIINEDTFLIQINQEPTENFVRPAADPLFRSVAKTFGRYSIACILTGLGKDGTLGAMHIEKMGGKVLIQKPSTCVAPSMPNSAVSSGIKSEIIDIEIFHEVIIENMNKVTALFNLHRK